jgi:RNA polymerase sigma-70 factor (ECF subfamily)
MTDALEPTDEHLVSLSKDGNLSAFNSLVERYQGAVYSLSVRLLGDRGAAEDATQEAFLSAYRSMNSFVGGSFRSWLFRIAANECKDELRRRGRRPTGSVRFDDGEDDRPFDVADSAESAAEFVERKELAVAIEAALQDLPFEQRQVILLSDVHGYHYEEIATITRTSVGTVKSRIHRGREKLRLLLAAQAELLQRHRRLEE